MRAANLIREFDIHEPPSCGLGSSLRCELMKLRFLRSTWVAMCLTVTTMLVVAILVSSGRASIAHEFATIGLHNSRSDAVTASTGALFLAQLPVGILGVLAIGGEFSTGAIRGSLLATPGRTKFLASKTLIVAAIVLTVTEAAAYGAFWLSAAILRHTPGELGIGDAGVARAVTGAGIYLVLIALLGVGIGGLSRSTTGGVVGLIVVLMVVPTVVNFLPQRANELFTRYLPTEAGLSMTHLTTARGDLGPLVGGTILLAWVLFALACAAARLSKADL